MLKEKCLSIKLLHDLTYSYVFVKIPQGLKNGQMSFFPVDKWLVLVYYRWQNLQRTKYNDCKIFGAFNLSVIISSKCDGRNVICDGPVESGI